MDRSKQVIIGTDGVFSADDAYRKIRLGASLVQLYTSLIYNGPGIVKTITYGLARRLERDGFNCIEEAVGTASCTEFATHFDTDVNSSAVLTAKQL
jgi:dihydroorotate dehydrogenase (fumarate)/dihydroorotate dehydrogenase